MLRIAHGARVEAGWRPERRLPQQPRHKAKVAGTGSKRVRKHWVLNILEHRPNRTCW